MREILFRGKQDNGEWAYGYYRSFPNGQHMILGDGCLEYKYVRPETVGQYTGMRDASGKRIFEGDILSTSNSNCKIWFVDWKQCSFCANQANVNYSCKLEEFMFTSTVNVIGNVHDIDALKQLFIDNCCEIIPDKKCEVSKNA